MPLSGLPAERASRSRGPSHRGRSLPRWGTWLHHRSRRHTRPARSTPRREKNPTAYDKELRELPDWRIGCIFTGKGHRRSGVARAAVTGALEAIADAGGGVVEAYPEQVEDRRPQQGAYFHTGPESLFEELGFERDRRIAKWRWVMRRDVRP